MPIRTRSFSGRLLRRVRSKAKLETPPEPVPELPLLPAVHLDSSLHIPYAPSSSSPSPPLAPKKGLHRRSRSFSELLSIASSTVSHEQPWRSREAWAAIHSPSQGPLGGKKKAEGRVMDRTYGWMERTRDDSFSAGSSTERGGERDVPGRQEFKFFHNTQLDSPSPSPAGHPRAHPGRSRLNESIRYTSDSSSSISTMELSLNPHTPPTSIDSPQHHRHVNDGDNDDLPLPPLLPDLVKRADSPPAFTRSISPAPWAQRSPMKDVREASNLRWAQTPPGSGSDASGGPSPATTPQPAQHRRKRSLTAPSVFDKVAPGLAAATATVNPTVESRPESGTLPDRTSSPPRPPRHPRRYPPQPIIAPALTSATASEVETDFSTPLSSPAPISSPANKAPSAYYRPTVPLRSASSQQSLRAIDINKSRRPETAPNPSPSKQAAVTLQHNTIPSPLPSATFARRSRQSSDTSSMERGGWI